MGEDRRSSNLTVDRDRLWDSLMRMAEIGALPGGGCRRLGLTPEDSAGRALLVGWAKAMESKQNHGGWFRSGSIPGSRGSRGRCRNWYGG